MPAEWQARQLLLTASEPGPWNMRSPKGRSTFTDFSVNLSSAWAPSGASAATVMRTIGSARRNTFFSFRTLRGRLLDDVTHESTWIPIGRGGLRLASCAGASCHQHL